MQILTSPSSRTSKLFKLRDLQCSFEQASPSSRTWCRLALFSVVSCLRVCLCVCLHFPNTYIGEASPSSRTWCRSAAGATRSWDKHKHCYFVLALALYHSYDCYVYVYVYTYIYIYIVYIYIYVYCVYTYIYIYIHIYIYRSWPPAASPWAPRERSAVVNTVVL